MVVLEDKDLLLCALAEPGLFSPSALVAEYLAARLGLIKADDLGAIDIILEGDSSMMINALMDNIESCD